MKQEKGFTIPELLVVIAIIGILLVIVLVNFSRGNRSTDLRKAGNALMQDIRKVQNYSIAGNSVKYCNDASDSHRYNPCADDSECGSGLCKSNVPGGGFGLVFQSSEYYSIFADTYYVDDTNPESPVPYNYFNNNVLAEQVDYEITRVDYTLEGIHILQYKFKDDIAKTPGASNRIDILFGVPEGDISFYENTQLKTDDQGELVNYLEIIVSSEYVEGSCRKVSINRISGQISEVQSSCVL